ncbi:MAG: ATP-binding protein [Armatimonadota bacterium]
MSLESCPCPRCERQLDAGDRYCRHCGYAVSGRPDFADELNRTIVETAPIGFFTLDGDGRVLYWSRAMEEQTGRRRRDALGRPFPELLPYLQPYNHRILRVLTTAMPLRLDHVQHQGDHGGEVAETYWFGPMLREDGGAAVLGVMEDITQRVQVDNQLIRSERLAAIGELAAGIAHNFNNIMAAIAGDAQLLRMIAEEEDLPGHVAEAAQQIYEETMRGGRVAHDLLSFARGAEPQLQRLDVREVIQDAVRLLRNHPASRAASVELQLSEEVPLVEADPNQLHQVFFNLILNAMQAMPHGGILTISAGMRQDERDPKIGLLDVKFHDTGVGIPRESLKRIFDPFFSRRAGGGSGSGLGLPVSLAMVRGIGGDIRISSAEGIGTTVTVSLPIVERRSLPRGAGRSRPRGRALLVDDDAQVRRTLTSLLAREGFEVSAAEDAHEAWRLVGEAKDDRAFQLILMELLLPRADGVELLTRVRETAPETPVIVLTGDTDPQRLRTALDHGARFAFSKPPSYTELLAVIQNLARGHDGSAPTAE